MSEDNQFILNDYIYDLDTESNVYSIVFFDVVNELSKELKIDKLRCAMFIMDDDCFTLSDFADEFCHFGLNYDLMEDDFIEIRNSDEYKKCVIKAKDFYVEKIIGDGYDEDITNVFIGWKY